MDKEEVISELRRVASHLSADRLSQDQFEQYGKISLTTVKKKFGSWNKALTVAGMEITPGTTEFHQQKISDEDLLQEIIRLTVQLGKKPSASEMNAMGRFSRRPYGRRWGSFTKAREVAYAKYGFPSLDSGGKVPPEQSPLHEQTIAELLRVAAYLKSKRITMREFKEHGRISLDMVRDKFGSWNRAVEAAGLHTQPRGFLPEFVQSRLSENELLKEIVRLTKKLNKEPSEREMVAKGRFSGKPYINRWGTFLKAKEAAYAKYGFPLRQRRKVSKAYRRDKSVERIDFRGLSFAPTDKQGVLYVFGMISRELGFAIDSFCAGFPDCEGRRFWQHVRIGFEYRSSDFRDHDHSPDDCNLIVCWIHDWKLCPIEVLELRSQIKYLSNR